MKLQEKYKKEIAPEMKKQFNCANILATPRLNKVVLNVGVGKFSKDKAHIETVAETLRKISGQNPIFTKARKSIASFKVREGAVVGVTVTLRGQRMYDFLEKLVNISLPRVRDFRGLSTKIVDQCGNATIGIKENIAFPEITADDIEKIHGLEVCITTTANNKEEGLALLKLIGFPFKKE